MFYLIEGPSSDHNGAGDEGNGGNAMKGGNMTRIAVLASVTETNGFEDNTGERNRRGAYGAGL